MQTASSIWHHFSQEGSTELHSSSSSRKPFLFSFFFSCFRFEVNLTICEGDIIFLFVLFLLFQMQVSPEKRIQIPDMQGVYLLRKDRLLMSPVITRRARGRTPSHVRANIFTSWGPNDGGKEGMKGDGGESSTLPEPGSSNRRRGYM